MKLNKIISGALAVLALGAMTACTESVDYTPGVASPGVYFPQTNATTIALDKENPSFTFTISRTGIQEASTYNLVSDAPASIFSVPATFAFDKDQNNTQVTVTFDPETIEDGVNYSLNFSFPSGAEVCNYGYNSYSVTVKVPSDWGQWSTMGTGIFSNMLMYEDFAGEEGLPIDQPVTVESRTGANGAMQYRVAPVFYDKELLISYDPAIDQYLIEPTNTGEVFEFTGLGERECYVCDGYSYVNEVAPEVKESQGWEVLCPSGSYNAAEGLFTIPVVYYVEEGFFAYGAETIQLDGFSNWKNLGYGDYIDGWIIPALSTSSGALDPVEYMWQVRVQQNTTKPGMYRLVGLYQSGSPVADDNSITATSFLNIDMTDNTCGVILEQFSGFSNTEWFDDPFNIGDMAGVYEGDLDAAINQQGTTLKEALLANGYQTDLVDGILTVNKPIFGQYDENGEYMFGYSWRSQLPTIIYMPVEDEATNAAKANIAKMTTPLKKAKLNAIVNRFNFIRNPRVAAIKATF